MDTAETTIGSILGFIFIALFALILYSGTDRVRKSATALLNAVQERWFSNEPTVEHFANEMIAHARKAGAAYWRFDSQEQALRDERNPAHRINLANLFLEYRYTKRNERRQVIQKNLAMLTGLPEIPKLWSLAAAGLYPVVRSRYFHTSVEIDNRDKGTFTPITARPWAADLVTALVYDFGAQLGYPTRANLEIWGVPEAEIWSRALANLRALPRPSWTPLEGGVFRIDSSVTYEESFLLLDKVVDLLEFAKTAVFGVPNRGVCLAADRTRPGAVRTLLAQMRRHLEEAPWPLSAALLERTAEGWRSFSPSPELAASVRELGLMDLARSYHHQKNALDNLHKRMQTGVFVASFTLRARADTPDSLASYAIWTDGVDTLLPKTDYLMLTRIPQTGEVLIVPWDTLAQICAQYLEPTSEDPVRYRVRAFPNEQEYAQLKAAVA